MVETGSKKIYCQSKGKFGMIKDGFGTILIIAVVLLTGQAYPFDAGLYQKILNKYVISGKTIAGVRMNVVDYEGLLIEKNNPDSDFSRLLNGIEGYNPNSGTDADGQIAFWINAYNIGAINLILMNYPVDSIRSMKINVFKNPWGEKAIKVNGAWHSLEKIEHGILLGTYKMKMIHFGIVCASVSCPELSRTVYTGANLKAQLETQARIFFRSRDKGISIDRAGGTVRVSSIFKFDAKSFARGRDDIIPLIEPYIENREDKDYLLKSTYELKFLPYNWDINSLSGAR